jgi:Ca-activated chloride channel family protein
MERSNRLFHILAVIPLIILAFGQAKGLLFKVDDWNYLNLPVSWNELLIVLSLGLFLLPYGYRLVESWFGGLLKIMLVCGIIGILAAIAVPNFRKARDGGGFSVGGAKDINTFRLNVAKGNMPSETDITHEGIFYDYYFNSIDASGSVDPSSPSSFASGTLPVTEPTIAPTTGSSSELVSGTGVFKPTCSWGVLKNPLGSDHELFTAIGLRSTLDTNAIKRKKLNLVVVLDNSGSMRSSFRSYYYDQFVTEKDLRRQEEDPESQGSKMSVANNALVNMLKHLNDDDRFGMVVFNSRATVAKPVRSVGNTDMAAISRHIKEITPTGGTNMEAGMRLGRSLLNGYEDADPEEYENRLIFLTDAMPNTGQISRHGLFGMAEEYASQRIYTTFIGVGVDFQTELVNFITRIRGANYYSILAGWEFKQRLDREFVYMVTPLLFNLTVTLHSDSFAIDAVYGSPEADRATGLLMKVNTLFPAPCEDDSVRGGIILLKLRRTGPGNDLRLVASYEDRSGRKYQTTVSVPAEEGEEEYCRLPDVRKAILLARFVNLMKEWIRSVRGAPPENPEDRSVSNRNYWEHTSVKMDVSPLMRQNLNTFMAHFQEQSALIGDAALSRELDVLQMLTGTASGTK